MHGPLLLVVLLTLVTMTIHGLCTAGTFRLLLRVDVDHWLMRSLARKVAVVSAVALAMLAASVLEAWLWSLAYLGVGALGSAEEALYFSLVTFTTLGYGDVTLGESWRVLGSLQAAVGIIVMGWSTGLVVAVIQRAVAIAHGQRR